MLRKKGVGAGLRLLFLAALCLFLAGCQERIQNQITTVCGDKTCSPGELSWCEVDCGLPQEDESVILDFRNKTYPILPPGGDAEPTEDDAPNDDEDDSDPAETRPIAPAGSIDVILPEKDFLVVSRNNLLSIGENVSSVAGGLTGLQLRDILAGGRLASNTFAFGPRAAYYDQRLFLRSGKVRVGLEEQSDVIDSYLEFSEGDTIFEYQLALSGGIFKFFEKETINFLGYEYVMQEVTNSTMLLVGTTTQNEILLRDGRTAFANGKEIREDILDVNLTKDRIRLSMKAGDEIHILPGQTLTDYQDTRGLLTNRIDLGYEGLTEVPVIDTTIRLRNGRHRLVFMTNAGLNYSIPLASTNPLALGNGEDALIVKEGSSPADRKIHVKDSFLVSNNKLRGGATNVLQLLSIDRDKHLITLQDEAMENFYLYFQGTAGRNATADLVIYNTHHKVYVGNDSISVDQNGDGVINGKLVPIVTVGDGILWVEEPSSGIIRMQFVILKENRENVRQDLVVNLTLTNEGVSVVKSSLLLDELPGSEEMIGMSEYGTVFDIRGDIDDDRQQGENLIIRNPISQRFANVVIKAYE